MSTAKGARRSIRRRWLGRLMTGPRFLWASRFDAWLYDITLASTGERARICRRMAKSRRSLSARRIERQEKRAIVVEKRGGEDEEGRPLQQDAYSKGKYKSLGWLAGTTPADWLISWAIVEALLGRCIAQSLVHLQSSLDRSQGGVMAFFPSVASAARKSSREVSSWSILRSTRDRPI